MSKVQAAHVFDVLDRVLYFSPALAEVDREDLRRAMLG